MPQPQEPGDIRLRKRLADGFPETKIPKGFLTRPFGPADANLLHTLLCAAFDDEDVDFERWWARVSSDEEYDSSLVFTLWNDTGELCAAAQCWTSGFVKDLATLPSQRGRGLAEALMLMAFAEFRHRGLDHVDLKTSTLHNRAAVRLYRKVGMIDVGWDG